MKRMLGLVTLTACLSINGPVAAQTYPDRPIRFIVPFAAAGAVDQLLRPLQPPLGEILGQPIVIENRAGGGSVIGSQMAAKSPPDGYTFLAVTSSFSVNPSLQPNLPYDSLKDFIPVTILASQPNILVVSPSVPAKTLQELVALAKSKPGTLNFASGGNGSSPHLTGELFKQLTGTQITHVPFKGTGPALFEVLAGRIEILFAGPLAIEKSIKEGKLRAIAIASARRSPRFPDVPTMREAGLAGLETDSWFGLLAPANTPASVVDKMNAAIRDTLQRPEVKSRLASQGVDVIGETPQRSAEYIKSEIERWGKVVKTANIKLD